MVTIWHETGEAGEEAWRARIEDVRSGDVTYIQDAADIPAFFDKTLQRITAGRRRGGPQGDTEG
jgi:hypothetical protein